MNWRQRRYRRAIYERTLARVILSLIGINIAMAIMCAYGAPPPGAQIDPALHAWFERQYSRDGSWCCNVSDGHILDESDWRISDAFLFGMVPYYEVQIGGKWYPIDEKKIHVNAENDPNPTGHAIVWYAISDDPFMTGQVIIFCFAPGTSF